MKNHQLKASGERREASWLVKVALAVALTSVLVGCGSGASGGGAAPSSDAGTLVIGMTAGDIPNLDTVAAGGQGFEGNRFVGNSLYDGLTKWDLQQSESTPQIIPGLAESWEVSEDRLTWTFHLRRGVKFHDGTDFDADAVIYNYDRYFNPEAPQYNAEISGTAASQAASFESYEKIDDYTIAINTKYPNGHLDSDIIFLYIGSPTAIEADPENFAQNPVGTGPFKFESLTRGQEATFVANKDYWYGAPKIERLVLKPIPDVSARLAALRSGEVNWIEAPSPDDVPALRADGFQVPLNSYDHVWPWLLETREGPLADPRVRRALNLAIDRESMATGLLKETADPAFQFPPIANAAYSKANDVYYYDVEEAKALLDEAGYPQGFTMKVSYPTSGSGNMQPGPMNQLLQADLSDIGVTVELLPIEWAAMLAGLGSGEFPDGADAMNISLTFIQESSWQSSFGTGGYINLGGYSNPKVDQLLARATGEFDYDKRYAIYAEVSKILGEDSPWLVVVNDRNPRALAPDVKRFIQPKSWFVDLTTITVGE